MSKQSHEKPGIAAAVQGMLTTTIEAFRTKKAIAAARKEVYRPYGDHAEALGAEAKVCHLNLQEGQRG